MDKNTIITEFDEKAKHYEDYRLGSWYVAQLEILCRKLDDEMPGDHLDIGCGTGWLLRNLASGDPKRRYVGIDISPEMIEQARSLLPGNVGNVEFLVGDWENFELSCLAEYRFVRVTCTSTLHYFADPRRALKRMSETLVEGGRLYLIERDKRASLLTAIWGMLHRLLIRDHVRFYTTDELIEMQQAAGFSEVEIRDSINRYFWQGKVQTNVVLLEGRKAPPL